MLTELYIEALPADEALADEVWDLWDAGVLADDMAAWAEDVESLVHMPIFAASNSSTRETIAVRRGLRRNMVLQ